MANVYLELPTKDVISIESDSIKEFNALNKSFFSAYIPGVVYHDTCASKPTVCLRHIESNEKSFTINNSDYVLKDNWEGNVSFDLYHLAYSIARDLFLKNANYTIHSSCVENNGLILIVGHSGTGKTTSALNLIEKYNAKWASGNKTLLTFTEDNKLRFLAGTETATIKQSDVGNYKKLMGVQLNYFDRVAFNISEDFHYRITAKSYIKSIALIGQLQNAQEFKEFTSLSALHALYPYFLDSVNADTVLCEGTQVYCGDFGSTPRKELARSLSLSLQTIPVYLIRGSQDYVVSRLGEI